MTVEIKVPSVGESVSEGELAEWFKNVGDFVQVDEAICSLETDKVSVDVPSPAAGKIVELRADVGDAVEVGAIIAMLDETAAAEAAADSASAAAAEAPAADDAPVAGQHPEALSPAVRRLVNEHSLDPGQIPGGGKDGRIRKEDVLAYLDQQIEGKAPATKAQSAKAPVAKAPAVPAASVGPRQQERVPMTSLRRRIASRLVEAQQTAAILTTFNEVDMSQIMALRKQYQDRFVKKYGFKVGFMSFFVKAAVEALKAYPAVNAFIDGKEIVYNNYYDVGVAVGGGKGLVVPVIRDADRLSFAGVESTLTELALRARDNKLTMEELTGGTFTISNGGVYGSMMSTPILNPPQSGILGMHNIQKRAVVVNDEVVVRPMMYLALSYDHRIVDGREAVSFLVRVKELIESPERILLEV